MPLIKQVALLLLKPLVAVRPQASAQMERQRFAQGRTGAVAQRKAVLPAVSPCQDKAAGLGQSEIHQPAAPRSSGRP